MGPPDDVNSEGEELYEIQDIIGHQIKKREIKLQVKWKGYQKTSWEPLLTLA